ncbi:MAG: ATP-binding protein [Alphaproteobacteria bacterium]|nr:ATP-binding protein [Alphaproteobacteria bacterium]MCB9794820.1 ATP-binding protein [Alphaproteobacteria bacterium]
MDEVGYLSYNARHADLLFEVVTRRYDQKSIVVTTNKPFSDWGEVFPNASCVVTLVHRCELLTIEGDSFRLKESRERRAAKAKSRASA